MQILEIIQSSKLTFFKVIDSTKHDPVNQIKNFIMARE